MARDRSGGRARVANPESRGSNTSSPSSSSFTTDHPLFPGARIISAPFPSHVPTERALSSRCSELFSFLSFSSSFLFFASEIYRIHSQREIFRRMIGVYHWGRYLNLRISLTCVDISRLYPGQPGGRNSFERARVKPAVGLPSSPSRGGRYLRVGDKICRRIISIRRIGRARARHAFSLASSSGSERGNVVVPCSMSRYITGRGYYTPH